MEISGPEALKNIVDPYGCEYYLVQDTKGNRFILESFGINKMLKEKVLLNLIKEIEARIQTISLVSHPRFIAYLGVTHYQGRPYLVLPGSDELWEAVANKEKPVLEPTRVWENLQIAIEIIISLHKERQTATGLSRREILWQQSEEKIMIVDPEPAWLLAPYRQEKNNSRFTPEYIKTMSWSFGSDVFALGTAFYHWLAGSNPFASDKEEDAAGHVLRTKPLDIRYYYPEAGQALSVILNKMMAKDEKQRPDAETALAKAASFAKEQIIANVQEKIRFGKKAAKVINAHEKGLKRRAFWRRNRGVLLTITGVIAVVLGIYLAQGPPAKPAVNPDTTPEEVMNMFFESINSLNHIILDQIATEEGAGDLVRDRKSSLRKTVRTLYVLTVMNRKWNKNVELPLAARDVRLEKLSETPEEVKFLASYSLRINWGSINEIQEHEDIFTLTKQKGLWQITGRTNNYRATEKVEN